MISHVGRRAVAAVKTAGSNETPPSTFSEFKNAVAAQFQRMSTGDMFRTTVDKDVMWECYLASFPAGSNPIFRKRTEHDCSCCRHFVRTVGNVVAMIDGKMTSIWDIAADNSAHRAVASAMSALVKGSPIDNQFLHSEGSAGTDKNFEDDDDGNVRAWEHFFVTIPNRRVCTGVQIGPKLSDSRALHDVLLRSLTELTVDAVDTVLELIGQNSLYRGEEHRHAVATFKQVKMEFDRISPAERDNFAWVKSAELPGAVSKIRNTSIGTLLTDLSEGRDMDVAVRAFESMVAPANYKRPTALVTKGMIDKARATLADLGLSSALDRRYAMLADITVNNILFADRSTRRTMAGDVFDEIAGTTAVKTRAFDKVEEIGVEKFLSDVLPGALSVELLVENRHAASFVSLIAPADATAGTLFKWENRFSWSYSGDFADSVRERVKRAGGNVTGDLCCRLGWFNRDDLDLHMQEPGGTHIYFGNKGPTLGGGRLDVDMNVSGETREPVENIFYGDAKKMREGRYHLYVHQFHRRETTDVGFEVEIDFKGDVRRLTYDKPLRQDEQVPVVMFDYTKTAGLTVVKSLPSSTASKKVWGIDTETFQKVNVVMLSPNHWDGRGVGNRHYFFMLEGCRNDGTARGFYNEFLKGELDPHRKVFEIVGSKMRAEESANQLSGVGFSSTQRNHAVVRVKGAFTRTVRVTF